MGKRKSPRLGQHLKGCCQKLVFTNLLISIHVKSFLIIKGIHVGSKSNDSFSLEPYLVMVFERALLGYLF
jgi:hypothetical protein